jgi:hypothetical protein
MLKSFFKISQKSISFHHVPWSRFRSCREVDKPSQPHNLTTSQPHNLTTSQPHNLTTSQPHNLTTSPPHHLTSQPHNLRVLDMEHYDDDLEVLRNQIEKTRSNRGLYSARSRSNMRSALRWLEMQLQPRKLVSEFWSQSLDISPQVFVLLGSTYAPDTLNRRGQERCKNLLGLVRQHRDSFNKCAVLSSLAVKYGIGPGSIALKACIFLRIMSKISNDLS